MVRITPKISYYPYILIEIEIFGGKSSPTTSSMRTLDIVALYS